MDQDLQPSAGTERCYRCDYNLRGIANEQPCPECGLLAVRSRRPSDEIRFTHPKWLRAVSRGVKLILLSTFLLTMWPAIASMLFAATQYGSWRNALAFSPTLTAQAPLSGVYVALMLFVTGVLLLTRKQEPAGNARPAARRHRAALRYSMVPVFITVALAGFCMQGMNTFTYSPIMHEFWMSWGRPALYTLLALGIVIAIVPTLLFLWLRQIARSARSAHLAEHCAIVGVGMSITILYVALFAWVDNDPDQFGLAGNWSTRGHLSLYLAMFSVLWPLLFSIWSIYLLLRFAFRFHRVAKEQSRSWGIDDAKLRAVN